MNDSWIENKEQWIERYPDINEVVLETLHWHDVEIDQVQEVLNPDFTTLHDPMLLPNILPAVERIWDAINSNEKILLFTDYDADGLPGAAIMDAFLKKIGYKNYIIQTPNRNIDGFGLRPKHVIEAKESAIDLIITIDCGSASIEALEVSSEEGLEVIITDHHEMPNWPNGLKVVAVVNPMIETSQYPFAGICGATVVYKLVQALIKYGRENNMFADHNYPEPVEGWSKWLLDLVAIATVGDMMELIDENRVMTYYGLKVLNQTRNYGLRALIDNVGLKLGEIKATDISFRIAPLINAASRLGKADIVIDLLTATDPIIANRLAGELKAINNNRKKVLTQMVKSVHRKLEDVEVGDVLAVGDPAWLPGMCGLLASRLVEEYQCPAFVWGRGPGSKIKGSCRSYGAIDVYELMSKVDNSVFETFGGHTGAGGFVLHSIDTHDLQNHLQAAYEKLNSKTAKDNRGSGLVISIQSGDLNMDLLNALKHLEPCGRGFCAPSFQVTSVALQVFQFGKSSEHLKVKLDNNIEAIKWRTKPDDLGFGLGQNDRSVQITGKLEFDSYRKRPRLSIDEILLVD